MLRICTADREVAPFGERVQLSVAGETEQVEGALVEGRRFGEVGDADGDVVDRAHGGAYAGVAA
jgi:hypothetical protein